MNGTALTEDFIMLRLQSIEPEQAVGKTAAIYGKVKSWMKRVPNLYKGLGNSPQALEGYLMLADLIGQGSLTPQEQQIVFMVANEFNECRYCVAAHSPGLKAVGFDDAAMLDTVTVIVARVLGQRALERREHHVELPEVAGPRVGPEAVETRIQS